MDRPYDNSAEPRSSISKQKLAVFPRTTTPKNRCEASIVHREQRTRIIACKGIFRNSAVNGGLNAVCGQYPIHKARRTVNEDNNANARGRGDAKCMAVEFNCFHCDSASSRPCVETRFRAIQCAAESARKVSAGRYACDSCVLCLRPNELDRNLPAG